MERERQVANLVQKERAAVRALHQARAHAIGTAECALGVAKELGFDQLRRERARVHRDEGPSPSALGVQQLRYPFFPRPGLTQQQDGLRPASDRVELAAQDGDARSAGQRWWVGSRGFEAAHVRDGEQETAPTSHGRTVVRAHRSFGDSGAADEGPVAAAEVGDAHHAVGDPDLGVFARRLAVVESELDLFPASEPEAPARSKGALPRERALGVEPDNAGLGGRGSVFPIEASGFGDVGHAWAGARRLFHGSGKRALGLGAGSCRTRPVR